MKVEVKAYGKVNLAIDLLGKTDSGYHEVRMVMQQIELHDHICICKREDSEIKVDMHPLAGRHGQSEGSSDFDEIGEEDNIACRAARLMRERYRERATGLDIEIDKAIPVAAGLAGGSADCAGVLLGINKLWALALPLREIMDMGAELGADVPFAVMGQAKMNESLGFADDPLASTCALAEGTGTKLTPLPAPELYLLLSKPNIGISTREVYEGMDSIRIQKRPDIDELVCAIKNGDVNKLADNMVNVLENYSLQAYDEVVYTKDKMRSYLQKGTPVLMSGSGPTVYAQACSPDSLDIAYKRMRETNKTTFLTKTV